MMLADGQSRVGEQVADSGPCRNASPESTCSKGCWCMAHREGRSVYLLGRPQGGAGRGDRSPSQRFPGLHIAGSHARLFRRERKRRRRGRHSRFGRRHAVPREWFRRRRRSFLGTYGVSLGVPILHGVGGSFDIIAGMTKSARRRHGSGRHGMGVPPAAGARRLWWRYACTNTIFVILTVREFFQPEHAFKPRRGERATLSQLGELRRRGRDPMDIGSRTETAPASELYVNDRFNGKLAIIGLGYIGLPTAVALATRGIDVIGVDINPGIVAAMSRGEVPFVEPDLAVGVSGAVAMGRLTATTEIAGGRCLHHRRADAVQRRQNGRSLLCPHCGRADRAEAEDRQHRGSGIHLAARHDRTGRWLDRGAAA